MGELKSFTSIVGSGVEGTVQPKKSDLNEYMSVFGQYGPKAGDMIVDKITRDMSERGFKVRKSENKKQIETDNVANSLLKNWEKSKGKGGK